MNEPTFIYIYIYLYILYYIYIFSVPINAESGRTDVVNTINDFVFTPTSKSAFENFTIVDDSVLEFDELLIAEFNFGPEISSNWKAKKGEPSIAFILVRDDDCELCTDGTKPQKWFRTVFYSTYLVLPSGNSLSVNFLTYHFSC